ncbi:MAG: competence/damage-inducible protein A [Methylotenera sp. 24-45-7]|jgi:molybdopterin-biosynthesis enzyme MoeA-like protein|nr:MAG: competence/damage-inducible protein A [Mehylophilales bacterium 35-46-6]OYZ41056.1 MAG: competence/damage-inducible protein A [Methylotenera sp. 24-45-7]OZA10026.1 MAG: competence/damage-inducible protein A [Methylotenera sp. 17-45-7]OZA53893.1 MAG: competence/damage-inducible protein A [Methylophilales bacterium 39-45-7]HQS36810.1 molybdopterin-binding protein [Methylotenera sp.]
MQSIGIYIIGDEILSGKRQDAHLNFAIQTLKSRGLQLAWAHYLGDIPEQITSLLKASMQRGDIVFSFGGIGATPDDFTRQCAADAAGVPIQRHAGAVAEIEAQYGETAYPKRVLMADFPLGADLIPNPVNRVAGFSINKHYFVPGFPQMAHPMVEWVLNTHYAHLFHQQDYAEASIWVMDAGESQLIDMMRNIVAKYPDLKLFSLPKLDSRRTTEVGVKGASSLVKHALDEIKQSVTALGFPWQDA